MATITTRIAGAKVTATRTDAGWEAEVHSDYPWHQKPFDLRSTYASVDAATALYCAMFDTANYYGRGGVMADDSMWLSW